MSDTERLVVSLEARVRDFERNMAKASGTASNSFGQMERRSRDAGKRMEEAMASSSSRITANLAALGKGAFAGLIGGLAIGGLDQIVGRLAQVAEGVASIGNEAKRAGLSTKAFQELGYVAQQNRIPIDALTDGMKELALRADEFIVTGAGPASEAFRRLGFGATELSNKLEDPSALLVEIISRMEGLSKAAQIRVADELFGGTGGERFVELLDRGAEGIREMVQEANDFGLVMDDAMIAKADEVDRRFKLITATVGTGLKSAIIEAVDALDGFFDQFNKIEDQQANTLRERIELNFKDTARVQNNIGTLKEEKEASFFPNLVDPQIKMAEAELARLRAEYERLQKALDIRLFGDPAKKAGEEAKDAKPKVTDLSTAVSGMSDAGTTGASGIKSFSDAIRDLKGEIPGLTDQLADLDARTRIDGAYKAALQKARSIGDTLVAEQLRDQALAALSSKGSREAANGGMLDLIGYAEGTDKGRGYNETLGYGKFTGGDRNLVTMTLDEVLAMQKGMLAHPDNGFNSSAVGRYQIVSKTLKGLMGSLGLSGSEHFDPAMQDRLAQELLRQRGNDPAGLRNEWEGLRRIDSGTIQKAYDGTSVSMPAMDTGVVEKQQANIDLAKQQAASYAEIVVGAQQFRTEQTMEASALGVTALQAAKLRYEQDLLNQAQQSGIALSPAQRQELANLAAGMAEVETATADAAASQEQMQAVQGFLKGQVGGFFQSIISGSATVEDALSRLLSSLAEAALQAALLGTGPLAGLFVGGSGGGSGSGGGGLLSILGLAKGGEVKAYASGGHVRGAGTGTSDSIPAMLSNGEYVINAQSTRKNRALLEAINSGEAPAFARGGPVGRSGYAGASTSQTTTFAPVISVAVEGGSSGDPAKDQAYAANIAEAVNSQIEAKFSEMVQNQSRPGNTLATKRFSA